MVTLPHHHPPSCVPTSCHGELDRRAAVLPEEPKTPGGGYRDELPVVRHRAAVQVQRQEDLRGRVWPRRGKHGMARQNRAARDRGLRQRRPGTRRTARQAGGGLPGGDAGR